MSDSKQNVNDVDITSSINGDNRFLVCTDQVTGTLEQITKNDLIADVISSDANNLIGVGVDSKLSALLPSNVLSGDTDYGGTQAADLNAIIKNGFYTCSGAATGTPGSGYSWFITHQNSNVGTLEATQRAVAFYPTLIIQERVKSAGLWGSWAVSSPFAATFSSPGVSSKYLIKSEAYDAVSAQITDKSCSLGAQDTMVKDVTFSPDGSKMYILGGYWNQIVQYSLSVPFDVSTAVYANKRSPSVSAEDPYPLGIYLSSNGLNLFIAGKSNRVHQYTLSVAFDISTAVYNASKILNASAQEPVYSITGIHLSEDGRSLFLCGTKVYGYTLTTAFDLATASYNGGTYTPIQLPSFDGVFLTPDGKKMFLSQNYASAGGVVFNNIYQYSLATAFSIATASYDNQVFTIGQSAGEALKGFTFSPTGLSLYCIEATGAKVIQYSIYEGVGITKPAMSSMSASVGANISTSIAVAGTYVLVQNQLIAQNSSSGFIWSSGFGTCTLAGLYLVDFNASINCATVSKKLGMTILKNGTPIAGAVSTNFETVLSQNVTVGARYPVYFAVGDTIGLGVTNYTTALPVIIDSLTFNVIKQM